MKLMDRQYLATPFYGSRRFTVWLSKQGHYVNRKRVRRADADYGAQGHLPVAQD